MTDWTTLFSLALHKTVVLSRKGTKGASLASQARRARAKLGEAYKDVKVTINDDKEGITLFYSPLVTRTWHDDYLDWLKLPKTDDNYDEYRYGGELTGEDRIFLAKHQGDTVHDFREGFFAVRN